MGRADDIVRGKQNALQEEASDMRKGEQNAREGGADDKGWGSVRYGLVERNTLEGEL